MPILIFCQLSSSPTFFLNTACRYSFIFLRRYIEMDKATRVQILNKAIWISLRADILRKGMHPIILLPAISRADKALYPKLN